MINWFDNIKLDIEIMDSQHIKIFESIHELYKQLEKGTKGFQLRRLIGDFCEAVAFHLLTEECIMLIHDYPDYEDHRLVHEDLIQDILLAQIDFIEGKYSADTYLKGFIAHFAKHIVKYDNLYIDFFKEHGVG